jgi:ubiquinone biosynthesis protein UbiJ
MWANVAAHIAEVMGNLSKGYDERRFNEDLAELERQVDEIKKLQAQSDRAENRAMETESENAGAVSNS